MLEPEEITDLQERLRLLLPEEDSEASADEEVVSKEKAEALEAALKQAFASFKSLPDFKFLPQSAQTPLDWTDVDRILISYSLPKDTGTLFVSMPKQFVSACLASALGAEKASPAGMRHDTLSPVGLRFACNLSHSLLPFIEVITGSGVELKCVNSLIEDGVALTGREFRTLQFSMIWQGAEVMLAIAAPARLFAPPNGSKKTPPKPGLAHIMSRVLVRPEVRMRLQDTTLNELAQLKPGDVMAMHSNSTGVARVLVQGKEIMSGKIGRLGNHYSIRLNFRDTAPVRVLSSSAVANAYSGAQS